MRGRDAAAPSALGAVLRRRCLYSATQLEHNVSMTSKTAILPQVRVDPDLRARAETALRPGESLSDFIESSVRRAIDYRATQCDFDARSQDSLDHFLATGATYSTNEVLESLRRRTEARRAALSERAK